MIDGINWWRAHAGLKPLRGARKLRRSSRQRARRLMRGNFFAHPARLRVPRFDRVGEVIELHGGRRGRVRRAIRRWARSPSHRALLLSRSFRYLGAGKATGRYRGSRATIWVVRLGTK